MGGVTIFTKACFGHSSPGRWLKNNTSHYYLRHPSHPASLIAMRKDASDKRPILSLLGNISFRVDPWLAAKVHQIYRNIMTDRQTITGYTISLIGLFFIFSSTFVLEDNRNLFFDEGGIIEFASAIGYFLCAALIIYKGKINFLREYYYYFLLIVMFGLRELDFHKRFTTMGILKIKFFLSPDVPFTEKLVGFFIVLLLLHIFISIFKNHSRQFIKGLKNHSTIHIGALIVMLLLGISKTLDGITKKLGSFSIDIGHQLSIHLTALEEVLELGVPIFLILIFYAYFDKDTGNK